jgi:hypothetical protein
VNARCTGPEPEIRGNERSLKAVNPQLIDGDGLLLSALLPLGGVVSILCEAYFDESGSHKDATYLCLAGLLFKKSEAIKLGHEWRKILRWKELPYFHMVDCAHGNGPFANLSKPERADVARRMIEIIKSRAIQAIAVTIDNSDFAEVMKEFPAAGRAYKTAYSFCTHTVLAGVRSWLHVNPKVARVAYLFEEGHASASQSLKIMNQLFKVPEKKAQYRPSAWGFVGKEDSCMVQAADLLAWQWYTDRRHQIEGKPRRKDCENLLQLHHNVGHLDRAALIAIVKDAPVMSRILDAGPLAPFPEGLFRKIG